MGRDGFVNIEEGGRDHEIKFLNGSSLNRGFMSD